VETPEEGNLNEWHDANLFRGDCGFMVLLTTLEYWETPSRVIIDIDSSFADMKQVYEETYFHDGYHEEDDVVISVYADLYFKILIAFGFYMLIAIGLVVLV
tara:strand:- start:149 stop:451 length:303 start_codon:yes stop_codon:yes gene_type:complete